MTKPTIHMNGTHPRDLLAAYRAAMDALSAAREALSATLPNARDYYPQADAQASANARAEHVARLQSLDVIHSELETLAIHVIDSTPATGPLSHLK